MDRLVRVAEIVHTLVLRRRRMVVAVVEDTEHRVAEEVEIEVVCLGPLPRRRRHHHLRQRAIHLEALEEVNWEVVLLHIDCCYIRVVVDPSTVVDVVGVVVDSDCTWVDREIVHPFVVALVSLAYNSMDHRLEFLLVWLLVLLLLLLFWLSVSG